ncbi:MAG: hypothetical protein H3C31_06670 [Brumimicrobium sp.]|nr:hypothetical protein [Brumimicrobium sp.]MCO5267740.1 hypothetical protein [Brumimicrobium sp.]
MAVVPIVDKSDNRNGIIIAIIYVLSLLFILFFIKYSEPDPPKITVPIPIILGEEGITDFDINNGGGGSPSEQVNPLPQPTKNEPKEQATQKEDSPVKVTSGKGKTEGKQSNTENTSAPNPFSGTGTGGQGKDGTGPGLGSDNGPGSGAGDPGTGSKGKTRIRTKNITSKPHTINNEKCEVALKLTIDAQGKVVRVDVIRDKTTTTNQKLIDEVVELAKQEVRYEAKDGAQNEIAYYTVTVRPS